ncbi:MAG: hypothetical protein MZV70_35465 [Desulfobacterales bacterium]|nr:hypothetical protein [Desulfobacterales bacterium]
MVSATPGTTRDAIDSVYRRRRPILPDDRHGRHPPQGKGVREAGKVFGDQGPAQPRALRRRRWSSWTPGRASRTRTSPSPAMPSSAGCGCVLVLNKWDLAEQNGTSRTKNRSRNCGQQAKFLSFAPVLTVSALHRPAGEPDLQRGGRGLCTVLPADRHRRVEPHP